MTCGPGRLLGVGVGLRGWCGPGRYSAEAVASVCSACSAVFGTSVCCVYIFHFVSSDTFRVKKSPKRSPLSDPPSQVYCSFDIYDFIPHLGVKANVLLFPTSPQSVFLSARRGRIPNTLLLPPTWRTIPRCL